MARRSEVSDSQTDFYEPTSTVTIYYSGHSYRFREMYSHEAPTQKTARRIELTLSYQVFESGAMLQYLVDQYDKDHKVSYPFGTPEYYETNSWVG